MNPTLVQKTQLIYWAATAPPAITGIILLKGPDVRAQTGGNPQAIASIKSLA